MSSYEINPYYNPEAVGLEIVTESDCAGSYEFDMFVVWRHKESGLLFYGTDSGCSCPTPFEGDDFSAPNRTTLKALTEETKGQFLSDLKEWASWRSEESEAGREKVRRESLLALDAPKSDVAP